MWWYLYAISLSIVWLGIFNSLHVHSKLFGLCYQGTVLTVVIIVCNFKYFYAYVLIWMLDIRLPKKLNHTQAVLLHGVRCGRWLCYMVHTMTLRGRKKFLVCVHYKVIPLQNENPPRGFLNAMLTSNRTMRIDEN